MLVVIVIGDVRDIVTVIYSATIDAHIARGRRRDRLRSFEVEHGADEYAEDDEEEDRAPCSHATTPCTATVSSSSRTFHCRHGASRLRHHLVYSFVVVYDFSITSFMHYRMHYLDQSHADDFYCVTGLTGRISL